jgi:hypothetical protein
MIMATVIVYVILLGMIMVLLMKTQFASSYSAVGKENKKTGSGGAAIPIAIFGFMISLASILVLASAFDFVPDIKELKEESWFEILLYIGAIGGGIMFLSALIYKLVT